MSKLLMISSDCHAGALPPTYNEYLPQAYRDPANAWWATYIREMVARVGTFFDQEAMDRFAEQSGMDDERAEVNADPSVQSDDDILRMLQDENNPFAPRRGEFDPDVRARELDDDGVAGEVVFPQMAPFGAGLMDYRHPVTPDQDLEGCRAYNRWLADFCSNEPERHAGVGLITLDDIEVTVREVRAIREMGLWGGVMLPGTTGDLPYYHHPRYAPLWAVCEELGLPLQVHSGWSPDYGDVEAATPMYITEVATWAHRPFAALLWSNAFEEHPKLKMIFTETGCSWILETLRVVGRLADDPTFAHFTRSHSLSPKEYFARNCFIGASFMGPDEGADRHEIGLGNLMWGTDYPHLEGTWPNTMQKMRETFGDYPEAEIRALLGTTAAEVYGFDTGKLAPLVERIGPTLSDIRGAA